MNFKNWLHSILYKDSAARIVSSYSQVGKAVPTPANYANYARAGYQRNPVAFACISKIAQACGGIRWEVYSKKKGGKRVELDESPLLDLMNRPNPMQGQSTFTESIIGFYNLSGNLYIEAVKGQGAIVEMWPVRPDRMQVIAGPKGYPSAYKYSFGGQEKTWEVDFVKLKSDILHIKTFNPLDDWYGQSPLQAAMMSLDQNNEANLWNLSLLRNSATPSGVLQMKVSDGNPRGELTKPQYDRIKDEFENTYTGAKNTGRPLILEGGLNWASMSMSPKDMDFLSSKNLTASDIAMVYGVPQELLGLGQKTFNNYAEARCAFYEETICPQMDLLKGELNRWLAPSFGDDLELDYDKDDIEALQYKRKIKYETVKDVNFLMQNEKREAVGYEPIEGLDVFVIGSQVMTAEEMANPPEPVDPNLDPNADPEADPEDDSTKPKPPKKPVKPANEDDNALNDEDAKGFKSFNLINANEKRKSWRAQNALRKRLQAPFSRDLETDFKRMNAEIAKASKLTDANLAEYAMMKAIQENMPEFEKTLKKHIKYTLEDFGSAIFAHGKSVYGAAVETKAKTTKYDQFVQAYVDAHTGTQISKIEQTTKKQVKRIVKRLVGDAIRDGESNQALADDIYSDLQTISKGRSRTIARTEVAVASTKGNLEAVKALQVPNMIKEWVSADDDRVRDDPDHADHQDMNGETVDLDEKFSVPPDTDMDGPCDPSAPAEQVINCRCVLTFRSRNTGAE